MINFPSAEDQTSVVLESDHFELSSYAKHHFVMLLNDSLDLSDDQQQLCVSMLLEVYVLADQYCAESIRQLVLAKIEELEISSTEIFPILNHLEPFKESFEKISGIIWNKCVQRAHKDKPDLLKLWHEAGQENGQILNQFYKELKKVEEVRK